MNDAIKPQGPIYDSDQIYITMIGEDNSYYVLTSVPNDTTTPSLVFQKIFLNDNINNDINQTVASQLVSFRVTQQGDSVLLTASNGFAVGVNSSNIVINTNNPGELFYLVQSVFQGLAAPAILMSGVKYQIFNRNGSQAVFFNVSGMSSPQNVKIIPLLVTFYNSSEQISNNIQAIFSLNFCSYIQRSWCMQLGYNTMGAWTTLREARVGNTYLYCPVGTFCSNNCVSFCSSSCCDSSSDIPCSCTCVFNPATSTYECVRLSPEGSTVIITEIPTPVIPPQPPTQSTTSYVWIIIAILFIIFLIVLFMIFSAKRHPPPHREKYYREDFYQKDVLV